MLWLDIDHTRDFNYFELHSDKFTQAGIEKMNAQVAGFGRRIVVIADCHIRASEEYFVYKNGIEMEKG